MLKDTTITRDEAIIQIRKSLRQRSGKAWSVTGGRGTAWGWITIEAPPKRRIDGWRTSPEECAELAKLLGLDDTAHQQGIQIPASSAHREEYVARAAGRAPAVRGEQYWD